MKKLFDLNTYFGINILIAITSIVVDLNATTMREAVIGFILSLVSVICAIHISESVYEERA